MLCQGFLRLLIELRKFKTSIALEPHKYVKVLDYSESQCAFIQKLHTHAELNNIKTSRKNSILFLYKCVHTDDLNTVQYTFLYKAVTESFKSNFSTLDNQINVLLL